jgi:hypothetical protein
MNIVDNTTDNTTPIEDEPTPTATAIERKVSMVDEAKKAAAAVAKKKFEAFLSVWMERGFAEKLPRPYLIRSANNAWFQTYMQDRDAWDDFENSQGNVCSLSCGHGHIPNAACNGVMFSFHAKSKISVRGLDVLAAPSYKYKGGLVEGALTLYKSYRPLSEAQKHDQHWTRIARVNKKQNEGGNRLAIEPPLIILKDSTVTLYLHSEVTSRVSAHVLEPAKKIVAKDEHITLHPGILTHSTYLVEPEFTTDTQVTGCFRMIYEVIERGPID